MPHSPKLELFLHVNVTPPVGLDFKPTIQYLNTTTTNANHKLWLSLGTTVQRPAPSYTENIKSSKIACHNNKTQTVYPAGLGTSPPQKLNFKAPPIQCRS
jgi:hypothetical protein